MSKSLLKNGQTLGGRYQIIDFVGQGGMQEVYSARDQAFKKMVVVKAPKSASAEKRFGKSAEISASVNHPNVAKTLDYFSENKAYYLVEEFIEGADLGQRFNAEFQYLDPHLVAHLIHHIAKGLAACHHVGVFHRDLKPSNILVSKDGGFGVIKITDFGIAKMAAAVIDEAIEGGEDTTTASSTAVGALPYMAPETFGESKSAKTPADIWSIGAILFHLLSGEKPFGTGWRAIPAILEAKLPAKSKVFKFNKPQFDPLLGDLWEIMSLCLQKSPENRPTADVLVGLLSRLCYSTAPRKVGTVYNFGRPGTGYGFIKPDDGSNDCFFHKDSFYGGSIQNGARVNFAPFHGNPGWRAFPILPIK